ncbi:MAG: hypothetical protein ACC707_21040 [Thiohalomonadales bacterium]
MKNGLFLLSFLVASILSTSLLAGDKILIKNESLYPEGISYDVHNKLFYVSSVARGEIWRVNQAGESELFIKNDLFPSTIGLQVDAKRNRLIVGIADPGVGGNSTAKTVGKLAGVAIYDLTSKEKLAYYNLAPLGSHSRHFANDIAIDEKGNIYVTDSFSPVIYKIDEYGRAGIFVSYPKWDVAEGKFGLNGIVYHPDGMLIVSHYDSGKLYKIDVKNPTNIKEIVPNEFSQKWKITGLDGLLLRNDKTLIAVNVDPSGRENGNAVYRLLSNDGWGSFEISGVMPTSNTYPTTLTIADDSLFVLHSNLLELFTGNKVPVKTFEIEKVSFSTL